MKTMEDIGVEIQLEEGNIRIDGELIDGGWKPAWKRLKENLKKGVKNRRIERYRTKEQQSKLYREQEQVVTCGCPGISTLGKRQQL